MSMTRIKICGMTRTEDAVLAAEAGADALGFNFFAGPRRISPQAAGKMLGALHPFPMLSLVGLVGPDTHPEATQGWDSGVFQQMHFFQEYDAARCRTTGHCVSAQIAKHTWQVFHIAGRTSFRELRTFLGREYVVNVAAVVIDTASKSALGGTGQAFNWQWVAEAREAGELKGFPPLVLAGGLTPENVAEAIRLVRPYAVDVSSGVEVSGKPGVKDGAKVRDFVAAVRGAGNA
jgi:phosphoribosylanthranilate isomerase